MSTYQYLLHIKLVFVIIFFLLVLRQLVIISVGRMGFASYDIQRHLFILHNASWENALKSSHKIRIMVGG